MKKSISLLLIGIVFVSFVGTATPILHISSEEQAVSSLSEATHTVLVEEVSTQACGYCPTAAAQLRSIYNAGDLDFYYITLLPDANKHIWSRVQELGTTGVPDVHFDGGYRNIVGAQEDETPYRSAISACGARTVPDIDLSVSVEFKGGGTLKITITVLNNAEEEFTGHLRVYVVEKESRWNDVSQVPFHFAALAIPVDRSLAVPHSTPQVLGDSNTIKRTWFGALYQFSDITEDNIMVIASVSDSDTDHVVQTAAAQPTAQTQLYSHTPLLRGMVLDFLMQLRDLIRH